MWYYAVLSGGTEGTHEKLFRIGVLQDDNRTHDLANTNETYWPLAPSSRSVEPEHVQYETDDHINVLMV